MAGDSGQPLLSDRSGARARRASRLVELAAPDDRLADAPLVFAAATGTDAAWRRAALFRYRAETEVAEPAGGTAPRAVAGVAETVLGGRAALDVRCPSSSVEIVLDHPGDLLSDASDDELDPRRQSLRARAMNCFSSAGPSCCAPGHYRLSRLVRGWRRHGMGDDGPRGRRPVRA